MNILLGTHHLVDFAGSELVIFDLAQHFMSNNHNVSVVTFSYGDPVKKIFEDANISVTNIMKEKLQKKDFDLMWIQHAPVCYALIYNDDINANYVISSSLSPFEPLETPPVFANHLSLCLANSNETRDRLIEFNIDPDNIFVFKNSVPDSYFQSYKENINSKLRRVAIISNHVPSEVKLAASILVDNGIGVDIYGFEHKFQLVTKEILLEYDAVVTIGRTVQQAMSLGIPVYCYDHFGGPGWITPNNLKQAEYYNFSGRCTKRKINEDQLVDELLTQFELACESRRELYNYAKENYSLSANVNKVFQIVSSKPPIDKGKIIKMFPSLGRHNDTYIRQLTNAIAYKEGYERSVLEHKKTLSINEELWKRVNISERKLEDVLKENQQLWSRVHKAEKENERLVKETEQLWLKVHEAENKNNALDRKVQKLQNTNLELSKDLDEMKNIVEEMKINLQRSQELNRYYEKELNQLESSFRYYLKKRFKMWREGKR